jgi:TRAP-type C4-dicarboxylate transport system substrate-binding protein
MKKNGILTLVISIFIVLTFLILPSVSTSEPVVLKTVTLLKKGHPVNYPVIWIADEVKKRSKGELTIKIIGGPESIPSFEQTNALLRGVIDFYNTGSSYVQTVWPEAIVLPLSRLTPTQERKKGAFDLLQESGKKRGLYYLGRSVSPRGYYMYLNVKVKTPKDLKGLSVHCGGAGGN